ncbi:DUF6053 domain-containing protein [Lysobacter sp. TAB13]|uniref:DUF6053 domain-containing protein n=1 Tax=Lysobacter sp. TAB13 TaxID=3233065 RepID=UPI003F992EDD
MVASGCARCAGASGAGRQSGLLQLALRFCFLGQEQRSCERALQLLWEGALAPMLFAQFAAICPKSIGAKAPSHKRLRG